MTSTMTKRCRVAGALCVYAICAALAPHVATLAERDQLPASSGTRLGAHPIMAFVATRDAARARVFYRDTLGLRLVSEEPIALVFDAHGTMLRVQILPALTPVRHTVLGWQVADISATAKELLKAGVTFERFQGFTQDDLGIWRAGDGTRVAWFKDPDGNVLSITQF